MAKILIVDDEPRIRELIHEHLQYSGYICEEAGDGSAALAQLSGGGFDLVILDLMMPFMDGMTCLREMRARHINTPVIILTARGEEYDKLAGLESGADDYVVKPFSPRELVARVKARLRRRQAAPQASSTLLSAGTIEVDLRTHLATLHGEPLHLTPKEFAILAILAQSVGSPVSAADLFEGAWHERFDDAAANTVMVHIRRLREKVEDEPASPKHIITKRGMGYYFAEG